MTTNDINGIRRLLIHDHAHIEACERAAARKREIQDRWRDKPEVIKELDEEIRKELTEAGQHRQAFAARTELLQFIDLGDKTADELIAEAVCNPLAGWPGAPAVGDDDPEATRPSMTAAERPKTFDLHIAEQLNSQRKR